MEQLVNINSGTANAGGVKKVGDWLKPQFEALGFHVKWHDLPENMRHAGSLVATLGGNSGKRILLIAHLDTVFSRDSAFQRFTLSTDKKRATGPGVIDDKGGLVTIIFALKALHHVRGLQNANITVVLVGDEELAAKPTDVSRKELIEAAKNSDIALGFEFALSPNELVIGRRGLSEWFLTSTGKAKHSSNIFQPTVGFGAVFELSRVLNEIRRELSQTPGLTINPGLLLGGQHVREETEEGRGITKGKKTIIAAQALAHGDIRFLTDEQRENAEQTMIRIANHPLLGTTSTLAFRHLMPVMMATEENQRLLTEYSAVSKKLGEPTLQAIPPEMRGGADISYISRYVPASLDGLGPWGEGAHSEKETLDVDSLPVVTKRAALFLWQQIQSPSRGQFGDGE
ncbi:M20 family metallopeptidase [Candidatus Regiella endosymbiont of Tuberolachnus salignus]|uniref:M20 family metallopeptidase n=1 Tax=Candidatus Regiella endosymbiont of Tuberolachnus salignus TaxID=3077956 RepID=UPI0030CFC190